MQKLILISSDKNYREYELNGKKVLITRREEKRKGNEGYPIRPYTDVLLQYERFASSVSMFAIGEDIFEDLIDRLISGLMRYLKIEQLKIDESNKSTKVEPEKPSFNLREFKKLLDAVEKIPIEVMVSAAMKEFFNKFNNDKPNEPKENPCIAVIVSDRIDNCRSFLKFNNLNPKCFKLVNEAHRLEGISREMPIIITHHGNSNKFDNLMEFVHHRFTNVRYIGY